MIGLPNPTSLSEFIAYAVNLPRIGLTKTLSNPGLARMATAGYYLIAGNVRFSSHGTRKFLHHPQTA